MRDSSCTRLVATHLVEQPAPTDRLELAGITDQHHPPAVSVGQVDELVE